MISRQAKIYVLRGVVEYLRGHQMSDVGVLATEHLPVSDRLRIRRAAERLLGRMVKKLGALERLENVQPAGVSVLLYHMSDDERADVRSQRGGVE